MPHRVALTLEAASECLMSNGCLPDDRKASRKWS